MIEIIFSEQFLKEVRKLSSVNQVKLSKLLDLLKNNPLHPSLYSKKLAGKLNYAYSFRINRDRRVIFVFESKNIVKLIKVGHRKNIYKQ